LTDEAGGCWVQRRVRIIPGASVLANHNEWDMFIAVRRLAEKIAELESWRTIAPSDERAATRLSSANADSSEVFPHVKLMMAIWRPRFRVGG